MLNRKSMLANEFLNMSKRLVQSTHPMKDERYKIFWTVWTFYRYLSKCNV